MHVNSAMTDKHINSSFLVIFYGQPPKQYSIYNDSKHKHPPPQLTLTP